MSSKDSLYTCWALDGVAPAALHVTHKYLGRLDATATDLVHRLLAAHFVANHAVSLLANFGVEAWFGPGGRTRVLLPAGDIVVPGHFAELRVALGEFRGDDFPAWSPHLSTEELAEVAGPFARYVLCRGGEVVWEHREAT